MHGSNPWRERERAGGALCVRNREKERKNDGLQRDTCALGDCYSMRKCAIALQTRQAA